MVVKPNLFLYSKLMENKQKTLYVPLPHLGLAYNLKSCITRNCPDVAWACQIRARVDPGIFNVVLLYGSANIRKTLYCIITNYKLYISWIRAVNFIILVSLISFLQYSEIAS